MTDIFPVGVGCRFASHLAEQMFSFCPRWRKGFVWLSTHGLPDPARGRWKRLLVIYSGENEFRSRGFERDMGVSGNVGSNPPNGSKWPMMAKVTAKMMIRRQICGLRTYTNIALLGYGYGSQVPPYH